MKRTNPWMLWAVTVVVAGACSSTPGSIDFGHTEGWDSATSTAADGSSGRDSTTSKGPTSTTSASTTGETPGDDDPIYDVAIPDGGPGGGNSIIPETCAAAEAGESTVGCRFYPVDLDQASFADDVQFAVVASNVQEDETASVTVEVKQNNQWTLVDGPITVSPLDLHVFELPDLHQDGSGKKIGGAYRLTSDVPIVAYQFAPMGGGATTDASLLYPASSWDTLNHVVGWGQGGTGNDSRAYVTIVGSENNTSVEVIPSVATASGTSVSAGVPGSPITVTLNEGDIAEVMVANLDADLTGTRVSADRPVGIFTAHQCGNVPYDECCCDHLEEQLSGLHLWGTRFVASRVPVRRADLPEPSLWQIYASENDTEVTFGTAAGVTGTPASPTTMQAGDVLEVYVGGTTDDPGDFTVTADKPIAVINYMAGRGINDGEAAQWGDPAMIQHAPVEQFLPRYVVLVAEDWMFSQLVLTRTAGAEVRIDDIPVDDTAFSAVGPDHEVARVPVGGGVHRLDSDEPFGVVVVGYDFADSYGYLGGAGTAPINPNPAG